MIILTKKIVDSYKFVKAIQHIKPLNKSGIFLRIFFQRILFSYPSIRNLIKARQPKKKDTLKIFFENDISSSEALKDLDKRGYSDTFLIKHEYVKKIKEEIPEIIEKISLKGRKKSFFDTSKLYCKNIDEFAEYTKSKKISHIKLVLSLTKNSTLKKIILSDFFKNFAKDFLSSKDFIVNAVCYISNPLEKKMDNSEKNENAQLFHTDINYNKFFKTFIYLSNVGDLDGPHVFIPGSHKNKKNKHTLIKRYEDNELKDYSKPVKFLGSKGSLFLEDTFGFHKGDTPIKNSRIAIVVEFGKNNIKYDDNFIKIN